MKHMEKSVAQRKRRWSEFFDLKSNVNRLLVVECLEDMPARPMLWWENAEARVDWSYRRYMRQLDETKWLHDDRVPALSLITGTEIFAEAFGCRTYRPLDNNPFALPLVRTAAEAARIKPPRLEDTRLMELFEMGRRLKARAGADALLSLPDVQTPMDIAALIWEKESLFVAMYDAPQAVRELSGMVKSFMFEFFDAWFKEFGPEFSAHYPDYYMPYGITMSEDEIGSVNDAMYREFFESEIVEFATRYKALGVHCCANARHQWGNMARLPVLKLLNIVQPPERTLESMNYFSGVCAQYPNEFGVDYAELKAPEKLHLAQMITVNTRDEARRAQDRFAADGHL